MSRLQTVCGDNTAPTTRGDAVPAVLADAFRDYTDPVAVLPAVPADACRDCTVPVDVLPAPPADAYLVLADACQG